MRKLLLIFLFVSGLFAHASAQDRTVSGKVTSAEDDSTLPGVTVVLKGTTIGTTSDLDGNYKLSVPSEGGILVYSFVGMASQELQIGSRSVIDVEMKVDAQQLTEVVVTSYGIARAKDEITYVTQNVSSDELIAAQAPQAAMGMVGKVAGMQVNIQNNGVNPDTQVILRGFSSISKSNEALIVIDGVIASSGALSDMNSNDIESINVLKGANAAALYGADAVNGALIVTTKRGTKGGKFTVGLQSTMTFEEVAYMPDFQTEYGIGWDGHYDRIENTNWGPRFDGVERPVGPSFPDDHVLEDQMLAYAPIANNLRDFYETGKTYQNTVYLTGGDETSSFYMSFGRQNTTGIVPDDEYERNMFRVNASKQIGKLNLSINSSYFTDETNVTGPNIGDQDRTLYWFVLNTPANIPLSSYKDWNNPESYAHSDNYYNAYYQNPYWAIGTNRDTDKSSRIQGAMAAKYDILENLFFTARVGVNSTSGRGKEWRDRQEYDVDLQPAHSTVSSYVEDFEFESTRYNGNFVFSGEFQLNESFKLAPNLGMSFINNSYSETEILSNNLVIPGFYDINSGQIQSTTPDEWTKRQVGFFGDVTLTYNNWASLYASGRQDYTSTLPLGDNGYFYPSFGASVVLTEGISALKGNNILSYAKFNVSNATVYNDLDPFRLNEAYIQGANQPTTATAYPAMPLGTNNGYWLSNRTIDSSISKEKVNTTEFGLDLEFLNGRINANAAYYTSNITDLITETSSSNASGASRFLTNIGQLKATGVELTLGATVLNAGDFKWKLNMNYTSYETTVDEIADGIDEVILDNYGTYATAAIVGKPFPQLKAQSFQRDPEGRVIVNGNTGNPEVGEVIAMGKVTPDYILGGTSTMEFKGITFTATVDYRTGHVFYEQGSDAMEFTGRSVASVSADRQDFVWPNSVIEQADGSYQPNNNVPITGGVMTFWQNRYNEIKENYVKDATALKLREVSVRYTFPRALLDKTKVINKLTIGFVGRNLLTFLPEENRFSDPEFRNTRVNDDPNGLGIGGYLQSPPTRTFGFNLNIEF